MKKIILMILMVMSCSVFAQTEVNARGTGFAMAGDLYANEWRSHYGDWKRVKTGRTSFEVTYFTWGEGKIRGNLLIKGFGKCPMDRSVPFLGIDLGYGEYEIYNTIDDLTNSVNSIGKIVPYAKNVEIILTKEFSFSSVKRHDYGSLCGLRVPKDTSVTLKKNK